MRPYDATTRAVRAATLRRWAVPAVTLLLTAALGAALAVALRQPPGSADGTSPRANLPAAAPALAGPTLDGGHFDLADSRGNVVLVNVFASWCAPCRSELPLLDRARQRWFPQGLQLVGLNLRDGTEAVRAMLREVGVSGLIVVPDPTGGLAVEWGVRGVPETFVVDRDGQVVDRVQGEVTAGWLEQRVGPLVAG